MRAPASGEPGAGVAPWPRAALLSLSDKRGAAEFAALLAKAGTRIIASGGTPDSLRCQAVPPDAMIRVPALASSAANSAAPR